MKFYERLNYNNRAQLIGLLKVEAFGLNGAVLNSQLSENEKPRLTSLHEFPIDVYVWVA
jgi:hypothetical protein